MSATISPSVRNRAPYKSLCLAVILRGFQDDVRCDRFTNRGQESRIEHKNLYPWAVRAGVPTKWIDQELSP